MCNKDGNDAKYQHFESHAHPPTFGMEFEYVDTSHGLVSTFNIVDGLHIVPDLKVLMDTV